MKRLLGVLLAVCMVLTALPAGGNAFWCNHNYKADVHEAVCDRMGYTFYKCQLCGHEYYDDYVEAPGHPELIDGFCTHCDGYEAAVLNNGVYEIYNPGQLYWFTQQVRTVNMSFDGKLMNDIVVNENVLTPEGNLNGDGSNFREWIPIGQGSMTYYGTFDGNGKTISGLYLNTTENYVGLFGQIGGGLVTNVSVVDSYIKGSGNVGGIAGGNQGIINNCYFDGVVYGTGSLIGGIVGENGAGDEDAVINCSNAGDVYGQYYDIGGIAGSNSYGIIRQCYNIGNVTTGSALGDTLSANVGGIVGYNAHGQINGSVTDCYNTGSIIGDSNVGGIIGFGRNFFEGHDGHSVASYCHNVGEIVATDRTCGGIIGEVENVIVEHCYYLSDCIIENNDFGSGKNADAFASGEVCQLLQADRDDQVWSQRLGTNAYPIFVSEEAVIFANISGTVNSYLDDGVITIELLKDGDVKYSEQVLGTNIEYTFENVSVDTYTLRISKENHITLEIVVGFDADGRFFESTILPLGDITADGAVNIKDYQRLLRHINKTAPLSGYALACGDITGDNVCNIKDLQRLLRHVNKTSPLFPDSPGNQPAPPVNPDVPPVEPEPEDPPVQPDQNELTIKVWVSYEDLMEGNSWIEQMQQRFQDAHPEYKINWDNQMMADGDASNHLMQNPETGADVFIYASDYTHKIIAAGGLTKLTGTYAEQVKNDNIPLHINAVTYTDEEIYGFPIANNTWFMYYNKDVFTEEDVKSLDTMVSKGKVCLPFYNSWTSGAFFLGCGGTVFGENGRDATAGINFSGANGGYLAAQKMIELAQNRNVLLSDMDTYRLATGEVHAAFGGNWDYADLKASLGDRLGVAMLPKYTVNGQEYQMTAFGSTKTVGVNPYAEHKEISMEFAAFLASKEGQLLRYEMRGVAPAHKDLAENEAIMADALAMAEINTIRYSAKLLSGLPEMNNYWGPMNSFAREVSYGSVDLYTYEFYVDMLNDYFNNC